MMNILEQELEQKVNRADTHIHTTESDGVLTPEQIVGEAVRQGLHTIVVTDHEVLNGAMKALHYAEDNELPIRVIPGVELSLSGKRHLLLWNIKHNIPARMSLEDTMKAARDQEGDDVLIVGAHPFFRGTRSLSWRIMQDVVENADPAVRFDGTETLNASVEAVNFGFLVPNTNPRVAQFYAENDPQILGANVGGSDSHLPGTLGNVVTEFEGDDFLAAVRARVTRPIVAAPIQKIGLSSVVRPDVLQNLKSSMILEPSRNFYKLITGRH